MLSFAFQLISPDLLLMCIGLACLNSIIAPSYISRKYGGIICFIGNILVTKRYLKNYYKLLLI